MKKYSINLVGNEKTKEYLLSALSGGYLNHAYIIEGKEGSGRHTLVKEIIKAMACENENAPCGVCGNCQKIDSGVCIDIYYVKRDEGKTELTVDLIRNIFNSVALSPNDLDFKAYVIEDGEKMNQSASNAFLKLLEEPPKNVYFFILTTSAASLLPTVRSRALVLRTENLSRSDIEQILLSKGVTDEKKRKNASSVCYGSAGLAYKLCTEETEAARYREISDDMIKCIFTEKKNKLDLVLLQQKNIKKAEELVSVYSLLQSAVRDVLLYRNNALSEPLYFGDSDDIEELSSNLSDKAVTKINDILSEYLSNSDIPYNLTVAMTEYASRIWDARAL